MGIWRKKLDIWSNSVHYVINIHINRSIENLPLWVCRAREGLELRHPNSSNFLYLFHMGFATSTPLSTSSHSDPRPGPLQLLLGAKMSPEVAARLKMLALLEESQSTKGSLTNDSNLRRPGGSPIRYYFKSSGDEGCAEKCQCAEGADVWNCGTFSFSAVIIPVVCVVPETTWRHPSLLTESPQRPLAQQNSSPYGKTEPLSSQPTCSSTQFLKGTNM